MFFLAELKDRRFKIQVNETDANWDISIAEDGCEERAYCFLKSDFQKVERAISFLFKDSSYLVDVVGEGNEYTVFTRGSFRSIKIYNQESLLHESLKKVGQLGATDKLVAGMPGKVVKILVTDGDEVKANQAIVIMEAMKMENEMRATIDTKIKRVHVKEGQSIESGATLVEFGA